MKNSKHKGDNNHAKKIKEHDNERVDEASKESFPASDPPAWINEDKDTQDK